MNRVKVAIMVISTLLMPSIALTPVLAEIAKAFPDAGTTTVQMVMTLPALVAFPASLFTGRLAESVSKKTLSVASLLVMLAGGIFPLAFHGSIAPLLCSSVLIGVGMGVLSTIAPALIADYFEGEERGALMGLQSSFVGIGATILGYFSGQLAQAVWYHSYFVFIGCLPIAVLAMLLLPYKPPVKRPAGEETVSPARGKLGGRIWLISLYGGLCCMCTMAYSTNVAMLIDTRGWGGPDSAGVASACYTGAIIVSGLLFGKLLRRAGRYIIAVGAGAAMVGAAIVGLAESLPFAFLGGMFAGYSYAVVLAGGIFYVSQEADESVCAMAIAIYGAGCMIGNSVSPIVVTNLSGLFGPGIQVRFYLTAALLLGVMAANLLGERRREKCAAA